MSASKRVSTGDNSSKIEERRRRQSHSHSQSIEPDPRSPLAVLFFYNAVPDHCKHLRMVTYFMRRMLRDCVDISRLRNDEQVLELIKDGKAITCQVCPSVEKLYLDCPDQFIDHVISDIHINSILDVSGRVDMDAIFFWFDALARASKDKKEAKSRPRSPLNRQLVAGMADPTSPIALLVRCFDVPDPCPDYGAAMAMLEMKRRKCDVNKFNEEVQQYFGEPLLCGVCVGYKRIRNGSDLIAHVVSDEHVACATRNGAEVSNQALHFWLNALCAAGALVLPGETANVKRLFGAHGPRIQLGVVGHYRSGLVEDEKNKSEEEKEEKEASSKSRRHHQASLISGLDPLTWGKKKKRKVKKEVKDGVGLEIPAQEIAPTSAPRGGDPPREVERRRRQTQSESQSIEPDPRSPLAVLFFYNAVPDHCKHLRMVTYFMRRMLRDCVDIYRLRNDEQVLELIKDWKSMTCQVCPSVEKLYLDCPDQFIDHIISNDHINSILDVGGGVDMDAIFFWFDALARASKDKKEAKASPRSPLNRQLVAGMADPTSPIALLVRCFDVPYPCPDYGSAMVMLEIKRRKCDVNKFNEAMHQYFRKSLLCGVCVAFKRIRSGSDFIAHVVSDEHVENATRNGAGVSKQALHFWLSALCEAGALILPRETDEAERLFGVGKPHEIWYRPRFPPNREFVGVTDSTEPTALLIRCYIITDPCPDYGAAMAMLEMKGGHCDVDKFNEAMHQYFEKSQLCKVCIGYKRIRSGSDFIAHVVSDEHVDNATRNGAGASKQALHFWLSALCEAGALIFPRETAKVERLFGVGDLKIEPN